MSLFEESSLTPLDRKARTLLGDRVVVKALAQQAAFHRLPRYVSEYLIAKFVRLESWQEDLEKVKTRIKDALPELSQRELLKERLLRTGEVPIIDLVEARIDLRNQQRWARVQAVQDDSVRVGEAVLSQFPGLLLGGLWGTVKLRYSPETDAAAPIEMIAFSPFQVGPPNVAEFKTGRAQFNVAEWTVLMLQSAGYSANAFRHRRQLQLILARLVPLVERNVNLIELGPRQTGKTFLLRNVSPRVFTLSGGRTTPANLFVNLSTNAIGILGSRKVVVFDEIANTTFGDESATISTLKDYMESGQYSRGNKSYATDASLVFTGNLDVDGDLPDAKYRHLFEPLPSALIDAAFLDRVHGYLPGWEIPKITPAALAQGVGFVTDYFGEVLVKLRDEDFQPLVRGLKWAPGMTRRDVVAVERITSGLIKLLHPHGRLSDSELREAASLASEMRQRVHNQLCEIAPGEFKARRIGFEGMADHTAADLRGPVGEILPRDDRLNREPVVGAVTGLAVIMRDGKPIAGDLILIQVVALPGASGLEVTGLHGRVLKDSVQTAYNIVRKNYRELGVADQRFREQRVAVHLVRIAEPKDGPSAGAAFVTGIVSALTQRPVRPACAVTGEVTLFGEVTGVGGIPQKIQAAVRAGRKLVCIPAENARELASIPDETLAQVEVVPVRTIQEVLQRLLMPS
jgi:ATP-dependent Lon protease